MKVQCKEYLDRIPNEDEFVKCDVVASEGQEPISFHVKTKLGIEDRANFVNGVASMIFAILDDGTARYAPYLADFARGYNLLSVCTDIDLEEDGLDSGAICKLIFCTTIIDTVVSFVGYDVVEGLMCDAYDVVAFNRNSYSANYAKSALLGSIQGLVAALTERVSSIDDDMLTDIVKSIVDDSRSSEEVDEDQ